MKLTTLVLFVTLKLCQTKSENVYPDIQDLFPKISESEIEPINNIEIDIERINLDKFKQKLDGLEKQLVGNETRRQQFPYISSSQYSRASRYILKVKALDLMLQAIYMTRHRVRQLENEEHFDTKDTAYRIAFLYRNLRRIWRKMMDLYTMTRKKVHYTFWYTDLNDALKMHLRIIKLYEDFQYLYWVMINVDGLFLFRQRTTTRPKTESTIEETRASRTRTTVARTTPFFGDADSII